MSLASTNNNFSNYFKHLEEFETYLDKHQNLNYGKVQYSRKMHRVVFPKSKQGIYEVSYDLLKDIDNRIMKFIDLTDGLKDSNNENWKKTALDMKNCLDALADKLFVVGYNIDSGAQISIEGRVMIIPHSGMGGYMIALRNVAMVIRDALLFDENYKPSYILNKAINCNYSDLPQLPPNSELKLLPFNFRELINIQIDSIQAMMDNNTQQRTPVKSP